jgi:hypothetical protein
MSASISVHTCSHSSAPFIIRDMSRTSTWDQWLAAEDSTSPLAPKDYDERDARARAQVLGSELINALFDYEVRRPIPDFYQDSTALADIRVTAKGDTGPMVSSLAWIVLSHFGRLVTVEGCQDAILLGRIEKVFEDLGLQYVPYAYASSVTYEGQCRGLRGLSWANRYFAQAVEFNEQFSPDDYD